MEIEKRSTKSLDRKRGRASNNGFKIMVILLVGAGFLGWTGKIATASDGRFRTLPQQATAQTETPTSTATLTPDLTLSGTLTASETVTTSPPGTVSPTLTQTPIITPSPSATAVSSPTETLPIPSPIPSQPTTVIKEPTTTLVPFPTITLLYPERTETPVLLMAEQQPGNPSLSKGSQADLWLRLFRLWPLAVLLLFWVILGLWFAFTQRQMN